MCLVEAGDDYGDQGAPFRLPEETRERVNYAIDQKVLKYEMKRKRLTALSQLASTISPRGMDADQEQRRRLFSCSESENTLVGFCLFACEIKLPH